MEKSFLEKNCPRCDFRPLKTWQELDFEERIITEKMPLSAEFSPAERKRHLFCTRCWYETSEKEIKI
jgi:hypothetical protein